MEHALTLSVIFYICGWFYVTFGVYTAATNVKSSVNRLFLYLTLSMAIWAFAYSISNSAPTAEASAFWKCVAVFGWGVFYSILLHFVLVLAGDENLLKKPGMLAIIYIPALINIILFAPFGYLAEKQYEMVQTDFGWVNVSSTNIGGYWLIAYYILFSLVSTVIFINWWRKIESHNPLKRQVLYLIIAVLCTLVAGGITDILPDFVQTKTFPKLAIIFLMIPTVTLFITSKKFGLLLKIREPVFFLPEEDKIVNRDRSRLFKRAALIFLLGSAASFLVGYFGVGRPLGSEFLLAAAVLILGILVRFTPVIVKDHMLQNHIFMVLSLLGMFFFLVTNIDTAAVTVWSVYIIFLLFTVLLDSVIHAYVFVVLTVIMQIGFWIFYPETVVTINDSEYLTRVILIGLSYVVVRYLTGEYVSKMQGYESFAKGQEALEKISSAFILVDNENAREKINEMFEISAEILEFDYAYIVDFDMDYEEATFLNMYVKNDVESEVFPYHPGMKVKTATLPMARSLIVRNRPIMCENIANISMLENEEERKFFISRGINSFFALPITAGKKLTGMFVVEYYDECDRDLRENRLLYLEIIANILGDARQKALYEERLYKYAYFDETTKLMNRNMLRNTLEQILYDAKKPEKIAILDIELDNLRAINDTFGHVIGEQIIIKSARILESLLKEGCHASRSGGNEFIVIMPAVEDTEQVEECASRIIDAFSQPISPAAGVEALFVTASIGISVYPDDGRDTDALLRNADLAGYEAKIADKKIVFYEEKMANYTAENTLFTNRLFNSLQNEEFYLEFQPQVSCDTGKTVGVEALLRWTTVDHQRIPPNRFIPILEQTGLIYDVGRWVLKQALQEHNNLVAKGFPSLRFSVNLSIVQFQREDFIPDFSKIIKESRVNPKYIELEITESLLSKNPADTIEKLYKLKELGVNIAIDDFGKGYSSLNRLQTVPFDRIKIDKDIIDYIDLERKKAPITQIIILLARAFGAGITAEGVETKEQVDFLRSIACDEIQGFYFSRPLSAEALEEFLKKE